MDTRMQIKTGYTDSKTGLFDKVYLCRPLWRIVSAFFYSSISYQKKKKLVFKIPKRIRKTRIIILIILGYKMYLQSKKIYICMSL